MMKKQEHGFAQLSVRFAPLALLALATFALTGCTTLDNAVLNWYQAAYTTLRNVMLVVAVLSMIGLVTIFIIQYVSDQRMDMLEWLKRLFGVIALVAAGGSVITFAGTALNFSLDSGTPQLPTKSQ